MKKILFHTGWTVRPGVPNPFGVIFGSEPEATPVTLPQDAMILEARRPDAPSGNQTGYYPVKSYTYEKRFFAPVEWKQKQNTLEFEGVMAQAMVFLNGELIAANHYGYSQFYAELNSRLRYGEENMLQVIARSNENASRWYPGAGIYRDVWLHQGELIHVPPEGVRLTTAELEDDYSLVLADVSVRNSGLEAKKLRLRVTLTAPDGRETWAENVLSILQTETVQAHLRLVVDDPDLWSPEHPALYAWRAELLDGDTPLDRAEGSFGIRKLTLDARHGLRINGVETKLRGACIHHDNGVIGATTLPDAEEFRMRQLKAAGFNAIRSAHHPAGKALLEACDRLGILVMDELADMWEMPKNSADYSLDFVSEWKLSIERLVAKDYNHPCVVLYSLGNEIAEIGRRSGGRRNREMAGFLRELDGTRYVTCAISGFLAMTDRIDEMKAEMAQTEAALQAEAESSGSEALNAAMAKMERQKMDAFSTSRSLSEAMEEVACELDVVGYNYLTARHEYEHTAHPERVVVGSETYPTEIARLWDVVEKNPHVLGDFTWTGYDYLGEAGIACYHYAPERHEQGWYPDRLAYCGDITLNAYRRPVSYLREIAYGLRREPMIAVERLDRYGQSDNTNDWKYYDALDSWTWPGFEGRATMAHVLSASEEVELFLSGVSLGRKATEGHEAAFALNYEPGELQAIGYTDGEEDGRFTLRTAGTPAKLGVSVDKTILSADGRGAAFVIVDLLDENGLPSRFEQRKITVTVEGAGTLAGFGSAHPQCVGSYQDNVWETFDGRVMAVVRSTGEAGEIRLRISAEGCGEEIIILHSQN
ncbi:MAG: DUF4982 domain-containing protein [Oscillospiraceae bacterium]|nr:DUF4982 domain-containing protein [Oscillospiraceae bacterium]MBQ6316055.1 DUF4982 domain-containing protein [Oscillospiraceae bacterium]